jgi:phosphoribosyl-AMP cyclohydrolase
MYAKRFGTPTEIHYYPRNYIKAARQFFEAGRVVEWCIDCDHDQLHCTCERVNRCSCGHTGVCPCAEW